MAINADIVKKLGDALLKAGAPVLKGVIENSIGGIGGKLAGAAVDALAEQLGTPQGDPGAIADKINADPIAATPIVQHVQNEFVKTMDISAGNLQDYTNLLREDLKSEGIISRLWRPLFALCFTITFVIQVITVCWLMWTRQLGTLQQLGEVTTFLTFLDVAGCAVLGVQVWKRTEEKKSGVS